MDIFCHFLDFWTLTLGHGVSAVLTLSINKKFKNIFLRFGYLNMYFFINLGVFFRQKIKKNYLITLLIKLLLYCQGSFYIIFYYQDEPMLYLSSLYKPLLNLLAVGQISAQEVKTSF